jgi:uncharacterized DUF497 family protein
VGPWEGREHFRKHGVYFEDAVPVFFDPGRIESLDDSSDYGEQRWATIGLAEQAVLVVVYTIRDPNGNVVRLISARKASRHERRKYGEVQTGY